MPEPNNAQISVDRNYFAVIDIEPYSIDQKIFRGKILPHQLKYLKNKNERDYVYFSRDYNPDTNDIDKVFTEKKFDDSLAGIPFTLVPANKVLTFYTPESLIQTVVSDDQKRKIQI